MLEEYAHIMTDPAHMAAEITFMILVDVILLGLIWPFIKRAIRKHDREQHNMGLEPWQARFIHDVYARKGQK